MGSKRRPLYERVIKKEFHKQKIYSILCEYRASLTEYGQSLAPVIESICRWGMGHLERVSTRADEEP